MSIHVSSLVWQCPDLEDKSELLVMLALADFAHDDGSNIYPSRATLAFKARQSERNLKYILKALEDKNYITREIGAGPNGVNITRINIGILRGGQPLPGGKTEPLGGQNPTKRGAKLLPPIHQEPSKNRQTLSMPTGDVELLDFAAPTVTPAITPDAKPGSTKTKKTAFQVPTLEEVTAYWQEKNLPGGPDLAETFWAFYESKGWKVGSAPMKNWQRATVTWKNRHKNDNRNNGNNSQRQGFGKTGDRRPVDNDRISELMARQMARDGGRAS